MAVISKSTDSRVKTFYGEIYNCFDHPLFSTEKAAFGSILGAHHNLFNENAYLKFDAAWEVVVAHILFLNHQNKGFAESREISRLASTQKKPSFVFIFG